MAKKQLTTFSRTTAREFRREFRRARMRARYQLDAQAGRAWRQQPTPRGKPYSVDTRQSYTFHHAPGSTLRATDFGHEETSFVHFRASTSAQRVADTRNLIIHPSNFDEPWAIGVTRGTWLVRFVLVIQRANPDCEHDWKASHGSAPVTVSISTPHENRYNDTIRVRLKSTESFTYREAHTAAIRVTKLLHVDATLGERWSFAVSNGVGTSEEAAGMIEYDKLRFTVRRLVATFMPYDLHSLKTLPA